MSIANWFRTPHVRRGLAASAVVLAAGGLVLFRADAHSGGTSYTVHVGGGVATGSNSASFAGPGAHGTLSLSHAKLLAGGERQLFADLHLVADPSAQAAERAPLAIAIVLDTSGSMAGEKIDQARDSVIQLVKDMRDDDQVSFTRYSDTSELVQPLARVGSVRESLIAKVRSISADGGTAIPRGLATGLATLAEASKGRVRRVVLVSDGLDSTRVEAEHLASDGFERGITVSSLGIGVDFDESYMGSLARAGHGNFGFVKDGVALATFLNRELKETAGTTVENATVRVKLPSGVRFVRATGADAKLTDASEVELKMGSLFAGDERRVLIELTANLDVGDTRGIDGSLAWQRVGGGNTEVSIPRLDIVATSDAHAVEEGKDGTVIASAASVIASHREIEAAEAYASGDKGKADLLIGQNLADLKAAAATAPAPMASALQRQELDYTATRQGFLSAAPTSTAGKVHAKAAAAKDVSNLSRSAF